MPDVDFPSQFPTLQAPTVCLRELDESDIPSWYHRATDADAAELAGDPVPSSIDAGVPWLERQRRLFRDKAGIRWAIAPTGGTSSVGTVGLILSRSTEGTADLALVLARAHWNQGIGTTAACMAVRYGLQTLGLQALHAEVLQRNRASVRLLEKVGFSLRSVVPPTEREPEVLLHYTLHGAAPGAG